MLYFSAFENSIITPPCLIMVCSSTLSPVSTSPVAGFSLQPAQKEQTVHFCTKETRWTYLHPSHQKIRKTVVRQEWFSTKTSLLLTSCSLIIQPQKLFVRVSFLIALWPRHFLVINLLFYPNSITRLFLKVKSGKLSNKKSIKRFLM